MTEAMTRKETGKAIGALLSIGELAEKIGVPTHVLRYWETRFPQLKPLQRSGRRRYYRPEDVALVGRIYDLLHVQGYTVDGARKALSTRSSRKVGADAPAEVAPVPTEIAAPARESIAAPVAAAVRMADAPRPAAAIASVSVEKLAGLRDRLEAALG